MSANLEEFTQRFRELGAAWAHAKGETVYLENARSSLKARLMMQSAEKTAAKAEAEAYASPEYEAHLKGLAAAVEKEGALRMELESMRMSFEGWRSRQATRREEIKLR